MLALSSRHPRPSVLRFVSSTLAAGLLAVGFAASPARAAVTFTDISAVLTAVYNSSVAWGDFDNDNDLDILLTGHAVAGPVSKIYRNEGGDPPTFTDIGANLTAVESSSAAWGDYDKDNDLDILLTGHTGASVDISKVYRNGGGLNPTFTDIGANLAGASGGSVAWGDYDHDSNLDILLTGDGSAGRISRVYRNGGGPNPTFTDIGANLTGVSASSVAWGDYDKDGDLDILLTGETWIPFAPISKVYRNEGGANPTFTDIGANLTAVDDGSVAWGDYDKDGDLDILLTGVSSVPSPISKIYRNEGGPTWTFFDISAVLTADYGSSVAWGDCDNDGDLDILLTGYGAGQISKVYQNGGGANPTFTDIFANLAGVSNGSVVWADYDNDNDLDILLTGYPGNGTSGVSKVYRNNGIAMPTFTDIGANLTGVIVGSVAWGDYDNDGDLDILLTGHTGGTISKVYQNGGGTNPTFSDIGANLPGVQNSSVAWGDCDNDGDLDILLTGNGSAGLISRVFRNEGGATPTFTAIANMTPVDQGSVAWGDYDNDGDIDILLTGDTRTGSVWISRVYRNGGGVTPTFTDIGANLTGVRGSSVAWGDYDNDGDLDILLTGDTSVSFSPISKVYRNEGGTNPNFTDIGANLAGVSGSSVAWGDYDNDGDLDILLTGGGSDYYISKVYRNEGGPMPTFTAITNLPLTESGSGSVAWGDYDNDGDLDILLTGILAENGAAISWVYKNNGGAPPTFTNSGADLTGVEYGSAAWGDYDNDGDLDILLAGATGFMQPTISRVYRSNGAPANTPPNAPTGLSSSAVGNRVTLSWVAASDDQTPPGGLSYNLRVGTTLGGNQVSAAMANALTGYRRVVALGNGQQRTSWTLTTPGPGTYFWSVQAIDAAWAGGPFAGDRSFATVPCPPVGPPYTRGTRLYGISGTSCGNGWSWSIAVPGCETVSDQNVTPVAQGGTALQVANRFAESINAFPWTDNQLFAKTANYFGQVTLTIRTGALDKPTLCVGAAGQAADCCPSFALGTDCQLGCTVLAAGRMDNGAQARSSGNTETSPGPTIEEIPTSGLDCNLNGEDDTIDIVNGFSVDANHDGVPDECRAIGVPDVRIPSDYSLRPNLPNPFSSKTRIDYSLPVSGRVRILIFDLTGRLVRTLADDLMGPGERSTEWNGLADDSKPAPTGVYFFVLEAPGHRLSTRLVLVR